MRFYTNVSKIGNSIHVREVNNGVPYSHKVEYKPSIYIPTPKKTKYKSLDNKFLDKIDFLNIKDYKQFVEKYEDVHNFAIYGDIDPKFAYICDEYPNDIEFDMKHIKIMTIDIETETENGFPNIEEANERVNLITIKQFNTPNFFTFGLRDFTPKNKYQNYLQCDSEEELLNKFLMFYEKMQPDVITGWNVRFFDIPYLARRIERILGEGSAKRLSFWKYIQEKTIFVNNKEQITYELYGTSVVDYYEIYKKNVLEPRESYKLDFIAETELGETKVHYDCSFKEFYTNYYQTFVEYNIQDVSLVDKLEEKLKLIELTLSVAYFGHVNYNDVLSQVRTWDTIIYNYLRNKNIIIPRKISSSKDSQFIGAYVKSPKVGFHKWVVSFDVNSLYPSIIRFLNIGVETKIDNKVSFDIDKLLKSSNFDYDSNYTVGANGVMYKKDINSFYSELVEKLFNDRVKYRNLAKEMGKKIKNASESDNITQLKNLQSKYDLKQKTMKIQLNSLYGAMGNEYFRFFDLENAQAVTLTGQFIIRYVGDKLNEFMNKRVGTENYEYVVYIDTDSNYLTLDNLVLKELPNETDNNVIVNYIDDFCNNVLEPEIERIFKEISDNYLNGMDSNILKMKREVIADKGIWQAKKRYILNVYDTEGFRHDEPKLKVMGIEIVKSSTPKFCREEMKNCVKLIMNSDEETVQNYISEVRNKFFNCSVEEISFPRSVNGLERYYDKNSTFTKGTPIHVKGALVYNDLLHKNNLVATYPLIKEGEKIKFVYLKQQNPTPDMVISFGQNLPEQLNLHKYIDYEKQFEKTFIEPLKSILDTIQWKIEKTVTLEDLFG